jgi:hypothetical protein
MTMWTGSGCCVHGDELSDAIYKTNLTSRSSLKKDAAPVTLTVLYYYVVNTYYFV